MRTLYPRKRVCVAQQRIIYQESVSAGTCLQIQWTPYCCHALQGEGVYRSVALQWVYTLQYHGTAVIPHVGGIL
jgi:hypothetical protein